MSVTNASLNDCNSFLSSDCIQLTMLYDAAGYRLVGITMWQVSSTFSMSSRYNSVESPPRQRRYSPPQPQSPTTRRIFTNILLASLYHVNPPWSPLHRHDRRIENNDRDLHSSRLTKKPGTRSYTYTSHPNKLHLLYDINRWMSISASGLHGPFSASVALSKASARFSVFTSRSVT